MFAFDLIDTFRCPTVAPMKGCQRYSVRSPLVFQVPGCPVCLQYVRIRPGKSPGAEKTGSSGLMMERNGGQAIASADKTSKETLIPSRFHCRRDSCSNHNPMMFLKQRIFPPTPPSLVKSKFFGSISQRRRIQFRSHQRPSTAGKKDKIVFFRRNSQNGAGRCRANQHESHLPAVRRLHQAHAFAADLPLPRA